MAERQISHLAAYLILIKNDSILFLRRFNTGWKDGWYTPPSGHVDDGESIITSMAREAKEECGVRVKEKDLEMIHVLHVTTNKDYISFFFKAEEWEGEPSLVEPEKSDDMQWFPLNNLPEKTLPFIKSVLEHYNEGKIFSEMRYFDPEEENEGGEK